MRIENGDWLEVVITPEHTLVSMNGKEWTKVRMRQCVVETDGVQVDIFRLILAWERSQQAEKKRELVAALAAPDDGLELTAIEEENKDLRAVLQMVSDQLRAASEKLIHKEMRAVAPDVPYQPPVEMEAPHRPPEGDTDVV